MKYLRSFEKNKRNIELVGVPDGSLIYVNQYEFDELRKKFDFTWDDEPDYDDPDYEGQWAYDYEEDNDAIEKWLRKHRKLIKKIGIEAFKNLNKYNL